MKLFDRVKVVKDDEYYKKYDVSKGMIGRIIDAEIVYNSFHVAFIDERVKDKRFISDETKISKLNDDILCFIKIEDLEVVEESNVTDEYILENLPNKNPKIWCKVENGYIMNLEQECKNKKPYKYNS